MDTPATIGVVTTDRALVIRGWNNWLADATGEAESGAVGRPLTDFVASERADFYRDLLTDVIDSGTTRVLAPAFHHYLIECAPQQPSAHFDRMQQRVTVAPLRNDAEVVGVLITLEDVTDRLDRERALTTQLDAATPPAGATLTESLASDNWQLRRQAVGRLKQVASVAEVQHLLETLERDHHDFNVLNSALRVLIASGRTVVEPLVSLLGHGEANVRMHAALALGELRAIEAVPALVAALEDANQNVRFHAIEALGHIGASDAVEALARIASSGDFFLAFAAIDALARTDDPRVAPLIQSLLADPTLRPAAVTTLAAVGDEDSVAALCGLLGEPAETIAVATALVAIHQRYDDMLAGGPVIAGLVRESIGDDGIAALGTAAETSASGRHAIARVLAWLGPRALAPLVSLVGEKELAPIVAEGLVAIGPTAVAALLPLLSADSPGQRAAAATLLGRLADRRAFAPLLAALDDVDETVVAAAATSVAVFADPVSLPPLFDLLSHPGATVRQAVVAAINTMGLAGTAEWTRAAIVDVSPAVREGALRIAGYFGFPGCTDAITGALSDQDESVRRAAIEQLPLIEAPAATDLLVDALRTGQPRIRTSAAHALRLVDDPRAGSALVTALSDPDAWVRYFAATSLPAHRAAPGAGAALAAVAHRDAATHVRIAAITALAAIDPALTISVGRELLANSDDDLAVAAIAAIAAIGNTTSRESAELLATAVQSPRPALQVAAIQALSSLPDDHSIEWLSWSARALNPAELQADAIGGLCMIASSGERPLMRRNAADALLELAADGTHRDMVMAAFRRIDDVAVPDIAAGLSSARVAIRLAATDALAAMHTPRASRELTRALRDEEPMVRAAAITAFGKLGTASVARTIAAMRRTDPDPNVRHRAAQACDRHGWVVGVVPR